MSTDLRNKLRAQRQSLSPRERSEKSLAIAQNLARYLPFRRARDVAFYVATTEEVETSDAISLSIEMEKNLFLPVINRASWRAPPLLFQPYIPGESRMIKNRYGIPEPEHRAGTAKQARALDLIAVPLVGFNRHCDRIGMGAGYYDRALAVTGYRRTHYVGLAFACQEADFEPADHDIPMHAVITEKGVIQP